MKKHKPLLVAIAAGAVAAAGIFCALQFMAIVAWGNIAAHPISYPGSILGGIGCLCVFFLLTVFYIRLCRGQTYIDSRSPWRSQGAWEVIERLPRLLSQARNDSGLG